MCKKVLMPQFNHVLMTR